ncbi:MAG: hypothetical protein WC617_15560 [Rhodanobacter sp.]|jgi:acyl-CoA thioesterase FadM
MSVALAHSCGSGFWLTRDYGLAEVSLGLESHTVLYSEGHVVLVWMNPVTGKTVPLPATIRAAASPVPA